MRTSFIVALLVLWSVLLRAQTDSVFTLETVVSGAIQFTKYQTLPTAQSTTNTFLGSSFIGKVLWRPNHLLAVGVQCGYVTFSSEDLQTQGSTSVSNVHVALTGIPLQLAISMNPGAFDLGVGIGTYFLQSIWRVDQDQRVNSSASEFGVHSWIGYEFSVAERLAIGPELAMHVLSNRGIAAITLGVRIRFDAIRY